MGNLYGVIMCMGPIWLNGTHVSVASSLLPANRLLDDVTLPEQTWSAGWYIPLLESIPPQTEQAAHSRYQSWDNSTRIESASGPVIFHE